MDGIKRHYKYNSDLQLLNIKYSGRLNNYMPHSKKNSSISMKKLKSNNESCKDLPQLKLNPTISIDTIKPNYLNSSSKIPQSITNSLSAAFLKSKLPNSITIRSKHHSIHSKIPIFKSELNEYEKIEIINYQNVYYCGKLHNKLTPDAFKKNSGFDDDKGQYILVVGDHIAYRYEVLSFLGKGSFGQVVLCLDHKTQEKVALKIIRNKRNLNRQAKIEIKILQMLKESDVGNSSHVIHLKDYFVFRNHTCITFELLSMTLYELLQRNNYKGFSLNLLQRFIRQILESLTLTYKLDIIHCDLKPENLMLINEKTADICLIDFGSACYEPERVYSYIQSRYYRSPEVILGIPYTKAIDIWSLGCIIFEFFTGSVLFPGRSEHDQLLFIIEVLDVPPERIIKLATKGSLYFNSSGYPKMPSTKTGVFKYPGTRKLFEIMEGAPEGLIHLVSRCLEWDPNSRIKPQDALAHPWLENLKKRH